MTGSVAHRRSEILRLLQQRSPRMVIDLAEELGVSAVTIRRDVDALAAEGKIRRTHGAVSELAPVRAEKTPGERVTIGMIVPHAEYYFASIIQGARAAVSAAGARLLLGISDYEAVLERRLADRLVMGGVHGLLFAPTPDFDTGQLDADTVNWMRDCPVPLVLLDRHPGDGWLSARVDSVGVDHAAGAAMAVQHLQELGHRRVALICKPAPNSRDIIDGYRSGIASSPAESLGEMIVDEADDRLAQRVADLHGQGVTALFVHNEQIAMSLLTRLDAVGLAVPEDISLVCYDDVTAALVHPSLTAVAPRKVELGERAVQTVLRAVGGAGGREHIRLTPLLHPRSSSWPLVEPES